MKVSVIGTVGVPAKYGGFETLVDNLVRKNNSDDLQYTVYCSKKAYKERIWVYHGSRMKYIGLNANGIESVFYDIISLLKANTDSDCILILGVSGCAFLPIFRIFSKTRLIINIDGLEHKRDKWNAVARWFLRCSERQAVKYANVLVSDNKGIKDYLRETYGKDSVLIAYGGDHVLKSVSMEEQNEILLKYGLVNGVYAVSICRIEPENNSHLILEACARMGHPLIFVGNWSRSEYGVSLKKKYEVYKCIKMVDSEYDLNVLYALRNNCRCYIHGHSAGGTNPSLVEAMFFGKPILAFDVLYNRETTKNKAYYFKDSKELAQLLNMNDLGGFDMNEIAEKEYKWEHIVSLYTSLFYK